MANNGKYSKDDLNFPEWLNEAFFENILEQVETESTKVCVQCLLEFYIGDISLVRWPI